MAYRLKHGESVRKGVKRIARKEIREALQHLRGKSGKSLDAAVREARKSIKKTRALLRLFRPVLGRVYAAENARLRDAGHKLFQLRDAGVVVTAFDALKSRSKRMVGTRSLAAIRRALVLHKHRVEEEPASRGLMAESAAMLRQSLKSTRRWTLGTDGFSAVGPGLERTFRDGKKALAVVQKHGRHEDLHEWRKRVKDHWYHIRLLENLWTDMMKGYENSLKELEETLGEELDLAILRDSILSAPDAHGDRPAVDLVIGAIESSSKELRERALAIGERVYAEKPRRFRKQMRRLWGVWREKGTQP